MQAIPGPAALVRAATSFIQQYIAVGKLINISLNIHLVPPTRKQRTTRSATPLRALVYGSVGRAMNGTETCCWAHVYLPAVVKNATAVVAWPIR